MTVASGEALWIRKNPFETYETAMVAVGPVPILEPVEDAVDLNATPLLESEEKSILFAAGLDDTLLEKPLFAAGEFRGIVTAVTPEGNATRVTLREARHVAEVYASIDVNLSVDGFVEALKRELPNLKGTYDHLNAAPLRYSVRKELGRARDGTFGEEIILRIDFPDGYRLPVTPRDLDCDFWEASCEFTFDKSYAERYTLVGSTIHHPTYDLYVTADGSFLEFGVGIAVEAKYDHNLWPQDDTYSFRFLASSYFKSSLLFHAHGSFSREWESEPINITNGFNLPVPHAYMHLVALNVFWQPSIEVGASGTITGDFVARAQSLRTGKIGYSFTSNNARPQPDNRNPQFYPYNSDQNSLEFEAQLEANAYILPRIGVRPTLTFLRVSEPLSFGEVRGGVKVDAELSGHIETGMEVVNSEFNAHLDAGVGFNIGLIGIIDYIVEIKYGDETLFEAMDDHETLYESERKVVLDWQLELLQTPQIIETELADGTKTVTFDIEMENLEHKAHVVYTYAQDGAATQTWDGTPIQIAQTSQVSVQASLENAKISDSIWAFGTSKSLVAQQTVTIIASTSSHDDRSSSSSSSFSSSSVSSSSSEASASSLSSYSVSSLSSAGSIITAPGDFPTIERVEAGSYDTVAFLADGVGTYDEAREACESAGGRLASRDELWEVRELFQTYDPDYPGFGCHALDEEGRCLYHSSSILYEGEVYDTHEDDFFRLDNRHPIFEGGPQGARDDVGYGAYYDSYEQCLDIAANDEYEFCLSLKEVVAACANGEDIHLCCDGCDVYCTVVEIVDISRWRCQEWWMEAEVCSPLDMPDDVDERCPSDLGTWYVGQSKYVRFDYKGAASGYHLLIDPEDNILEEPIRNYRCVQERSGNMPNWMETDDVEYDGWDGAVAECAARGGRLPTIEELESAYLNDNGDNGLPPPGLEPRLYWSSTEVDAYDAMAFQFAAKPVLYDWETPFGPDSEGKYRALAFQCVQ